MASKHRSALANYTYDRNIIVRFTGDIGDTLLFTVTWPRNLSQRVRHGFERRLRADNPGMACDIIYKTLCEPDRRIVLRP